tara:strand:- start:19544 stop:20065 length:522 start_codon:yes stop_codon:yes gene_type:complete
MDRKGISPLIATVLLIGFTIVLAAVVIRWGGDFITETTDTTSCESDLAQACATQVQFSIGSPSLDEATDEITLTLTNDADYAIDSFTWVLNLDGSTVNSADIVEGLEAFETKTLETTFVDPDSDEGADYDLVLDVEYDVDVIPLISVEDAVDCDGACGDNRDSTSVIKLAETE